MTKTFTYPSIKIDQFKPSVTIHPGGVYEWRDTGHVEWSPERQTYQLRDGRDGSLLLEVESGKGKRRKTREKMQALAEDVAALRATGPRRERALKRAGL